MDGLSGVASIITVIHVATRVASLSYEYISGVKQTPKTLTRLVDELKSISTVLANLQIYAQENPQSTILRELDAPFKLWLVDMRKLRDKLESKKNSKGWGAALVRFQWPFGEKETLDFVQGIERLKSLLTLAVNTDQLYWSKAIAEDVQKIKEGKQKEDTARTDEKRTKVLNWLYNEVFDKRHNEISGRRKKNTGRWILGEPEVKSWRKRPGLLWGYGIPGAGKTFLSSLLIDDLREQAKLENYGVAYIYFSFQEQDQQNPTSVLASLVKQLALHIRDLPEEIEALHEQLDLQQQRPGFKELYAILLVVASSFAQTFVVCDALDECHQKSQRVALLPLFHRMGGDGMSLFLTSREHPEDIQQSFENTAKIMLWAKDEDIAYYIEQKIDENPRTKRLVASGQANCKDIIISGLRDCAKGMFLLVHFHIEHLCEQTTIRQILAELERFKHSSSSGEDSPLGPTYDRAMATIRTKPKNCTRLAYKILSWLIKARKVLTLLEIQQAVSMEQGQTTYDELDLPHINTLLDVCASLVTVDKAGNIPTIRLVHYTVQEYLLQDPVIVQRADLEVAMACTTFLSLDIFSQGACNSQRLFSARLELYPFLGYAARQLSFHLKACDEAVSTEFVLRFLGNMGYISTYLQVVHSRWSWRYDTYPKQQTPLHVSAVLGHYSVVQRLLEKDVDIAATDDNKKTALHLAVEEGHSSVVQLLLDKAPDISAVDNDGETALHLAIKKRRRSIIELLLDKAPDISTADRYGRTALHLAVVVGEGNSSVVQLLLEKGADTSAADNDGRTAFHLALMKGNPWVIQLLLKKGVNTFVVDNDGQTTLHLAANEGHNWVVQLLLERGADIFATDKGGRTALHYGARAYSGHDSIQMLLENGADVSAIDNSGKTTLHHAAMFGRRESIQMLLEKGADISAVDNGGKTALHYVAVAFGGRDSVPLLLEKGVDISAADNCGKTALHFAAVKGDSTMVQLLLRGGADTSAVDHDGNTVLHVAVVRGHDSVVNLLANECAAMSE